MRKPVAILAALVLVGLGLSSAFLLTNSGAVGAVTYPTSGDAKAGDIKGQGFGKLWFAVRPSGLLVRA